MIRQRYDRAQGRFEKKSLIALVFPLVKELSIAPLAPHDLLESSSLASVLCAKPFSTIINTGWAGGLVLCSAHLLNESLPHSPSLSLIGRRGSPDSSSFFLLSLHHLTSELLFSFQLANSALCFTTPSFFSPTLLIQPSNRSALRARFHN